MSSRRAARLAWSLWGLALLLLAANITLTVLNRSLSETEDVIFVPVSVLMALAYSTVGALIASRQRRNAIGWLFLVLALGVVVGILSEEYPIYALRTASEPLPGAVWIGWLNQLTLVALAAVPMVFLLFPTGRPPSPRWRILVWVIGVAVVLVVVGTIVKPGFITPAVGIRLENPTGVEAFRSIAGIVIGLGGYPLGVAALLSAVALFVRFRRAQAEERQQIKWLAYVAIAGALLTVGTIVSGIVAEARGGRGSWLNDIFFSVTVLVIALAIPAASAVAILKYRLYELDVVVKKTVVFGILAVFITLGYFLVVIGIPTMLFGTAGGAVNLIPFVAAAVLALLFQPVRHWASRLANRLVYGRRATPYEVLSELSQRMGTAYSAEDVLPRIARVLAEGTGSARADVWLHVGGELRPAASWPADTGPLQPVALGGDDPPSLPDADRTFPVRHQGELLGALAVTMPRGESPTPALEKLLGDAASQAGLVLRNVRLIEELRASRQRLVAAQDEERRRLERNIHDGAQQQLVALAVKLRLLGAVAEKDASKAKDLADQLRQETQDALENLRDLARGIYPPLLADKGLAAALESQARKAGVPVAVEPNGIGRYPAEVEATAYFCVLEALQNVTKYADAAQAVVTLREEDGALRFEVQDDGRGFDASTARGTGLQNMEDRVDALGGSLDIRSQVGKGTTVVGRIPLAAMEAGT